MYDFIMTDKGVYAGLVLLWISLSVIIYWVYRKVELPRVTVLEFEPKKRHVQIAISHRLNKVPIHLNMSNSSFQFEGVDYYWMPIREEYNEVYALYVEKNGRLKEILKVDFTETQILNSAYV